MSAVRRPLDARKLTLWLVSLLALELLIALLALGYGSSTLTPSKIITSLLSAESDPGVSAILWQARMPRVWFAAIVGGALAMGGVVFQSVLRNPLADPYVLGISGGAALTTTLFLATGLGAMLPAMIGPPAMAILGAAITMALLFGARRVLAPGRQGAYALLLMGVVFNAFASALITFVKAIVDARKAQELLFYLMGSLSVEGVGVNVMVFASVAVMLVLAGLWAMSSDLNVMSLGEDEARALGVDTKRVMWASVALASTGVAIAVAYTGLIGFVGLVIPHALRLIMGPDHRLLIPASALGGAAFLTGCDLLARVSFELFSTTLPVGVITSLLGAPIFAWLLLRSAKRGFV